ncbi:MAG: TonB-dependent receptor [Bacteroidales bacterium]|jgi:iron complex outermembrane receptor protein|nr:TonB-dependent receptor [Bacteroidales bacterium]
MKRLLLLTLLQITAASLYAQYSVSGTVETDQGARLTGAGVVFNNRVAISDDEGRFRFADVKSGDYRLTASFLGYNPAAQTVKVSGDVSLKLVLTPSHILTEEVLVQGVRAGDRTPVARTNVGKATLNERNMGQDIPFLLNLTPSFVATSDAGTGIGYTNFWIRGADLNRINVTVNGIPVNDAESHSTFFVDIPDLAESTDNVQVQRGVGTSTNGAAAFGGSINMQTNSMHSEPYAELKNSAGSFGTIRNTVSVGTGLTGHFAADLRLSRVTSDGFIDRASANLKSFFASAGYYSDNTILKLNVFSGVETTYQAWNGVPSVKLNGDAAGMERYRDHWLLGNSQRENDIRYDDMLRSNARTYNLYTYENEVDQYQQDYYQLHGSHRFGNNWDMNAALFLTHGEGYFENFDYDESYADYGMTEPMPGAVTDLVKRKWLDNNLYGLLFSLKHEAGASLLTIGGGWNRYEGKHFGRIVRAANFGDNAMDFEWYRGTGDKRDASIYAKYQYRLTDALSLYADLQYRDIDYKIGGIDDDLRDVSGQHNYHFFNPKAGLFYRPNPNHEAYFGYGRANREPNRSNFTDADPNGPLPVAETLDDFEAGYTWRTPALALGFNAFFMNYRDQLILTGEINDVGGAIMVNADKSYRAGIELMFNSKITSTLNWNLNATFSSNKVRNFYEHVDNWDTGIQDVIALGTTDLAFSPSAMANSHLTFAPTDALSFSLSSNYVGRQYIDNTASADRSLDPWFVSSLHVQYSLFDVLFKQMDILLSVNNLFDTAYESYAWVYSYVYGGQRYKMDGYFPQAGIHFMAGLNIRL